MYARSRSLLSPRSSGDRAPPSGGGGVGSNPTGGTYLFRPTAKPFRPARVATTSATAVQRRVLTGPIGDPAGLADAGEHHARRTDVPGATVDHAALELVGLDLGERLGEHEELRRPQVGVHVLHHRQHAALHE